MYGSADVIALMTARGTRATLSNREQGRANKKRLHRRVSDWLVAVEDGVVVQYERQAVFTELLYRGRLSRPTSRFAGPAAPAAERGR